MTKESQKTTDLVFDPENYWHRTALLMYMKVVSLRKEMGDFLKTIFQIVWVGGAIVFTIFVCPLLFVLLGLIAFMFLILLSIFLLLVAVSFLSPIFYQLVNDLI